MLEFKTTATFKPTEEIINLLGNFTYKTKNGATKTINKTNLQVNEPTEYKITQPIKLTILEYKLDEISNKPFYIKEHKKKYAFKELKNILNQYN